MPSTTLSELSLDVLMLIEQWAFQDATKIKIQPELAQACIALHMLWFALLCKQLIALDTKRKGYFAGMYVWLHPSDCSCDRHLWWLRQHPAKCPCLGFWAALLKWLGYRSSSSTMAAGERHVLSDRAFTLHQSRSSLLQESFSLQAAVQNSKHLPQET